MARHYVTGYYISHGSLRLQKELASIWERNFCFVVRHESGSINRLAVIWR